MFEVTILIPSHDNDGNAFPADAFIVFEEQAARYFGGFTRLPGSAYGGWIGPRGLDRDSTYLYVVALKSIEQGKPLADLVKQAKVLFKQDAIFIRYLGVAEAI